MSSGDFAENKQRGTRTLYFDNASIECSVDYAQYNFICEGHQPFILWITGFFIYVIFA